MGMLAVQACAHKNQPTLCCMIGLAKVTQVQSLAGSGPLGDTDRASAWGLWQQQACRMVAVNPAHSNAEGLPPELMVQCLYPLHDVIHIRTGCTKPCHLRERRSRVVVPVFLPLIAMQGTKHREGFWRAWRLSGALLEFSSWSSRQAPCFQHHLVNSTSTAQEVAAQLQQQLLIRRKARQAALEAEQRRKNRKGQPTSATDTLDNDRARGEGGYEAGSTWQGFAVWASVLVIVAGYSITRTRVVTVAPLVAAAGVVCYISNGVLLPDEAYVQHLASVFDADGMHAVLVRPCMHREGLRAAGRG